MKVSLTLSLFFRLSDEGPSGHDKFVPRVSRGSDQIIGNSRQVFFFVIDSPLAHIEKE